MEYRLLGPVEVEREGRVLRLGGPKQRAVLAILLLRRGSSVPSDVLIDELWGEHAPETARNALQGYVFQLRKVLEPEVERGEPHRRLVTDGAGYRFELGPGELDIDRFERLSAEGRDLARLEPGCGRGAPRRGARALERPAAGGVCLRGVRSAADRPARGGTARHARDEVRARTGARRSRAHHRRARGAGPRAAPSRTPPRPPDARALSLRAPRRGARDLPGSAGSPRRRARPRTERRPAEA